MARQAKRSRSNQPTVWQALNDPVVEISQEFAKTILLVSFVIIAMAWLSPYFGNTSQASFKFSTGYPRPVVAGAYIETVAAAAEQVIPEWYLTTNRITGDVQSSFALAANEVLDISEPVSGIVEFYGPGVQAVWNAWLELMADPY